MRICLQNEVIPIYNLFEQSCIYNKSQFQILMAFNLKKEEKKERNEQYTIIFVTQYAILIPDFHGVNFMEQVYCGGGLTGPAGNIVHLR